MRLLALLCLISFPVWAINTPSGPMNDVSVSGNFSVTGTTLLGGIFQVSTTTTGVLGLIEGDTNSANSFRVKNGSTGTGARAEITINNGTDTLFLSTPGVNFTTVDILQAGFGVIRANTTNGLNIGTVTSTPIVFQTNTGERMRLTSAGRLGIGLITPSVPLEVSGTISATILRMSTPTSSSVGKFVCYNSTTLSLNISGVACDGT